MKLSITYEKVIKKPFRHTIICQLNFEGEKEETIDLINHYQDKKILEVIVFERSDTLYHQSVFGISNNRLGVK